MSAAAPRWRWGDEPAPLLEALAAGGFLALPTESSYGLAADPRRADGVAAIFGWKGRERGKPLPVVAADAGAFERLGADLEAAERLGLTRGWPGPLTLLLPLARPLPAAAGSDRLACRVPGHARLRALLARLGPLTATSANLAGEPPIVDPEALARALAGVRAIVVDDGLLPGGAPSTLVRVDDRGYAIVRPGRMPEAEVARLAAAGGGTPRAGR